MTEPTPNELLATPNLVVNPSVSSSRAGRSAEIEKLIWEMVDALGTIDGVAMNDWGEGDPEFVDDGDHANWVSIMGGMIRRNAELPSGRER